MSKTYRICRRCQCYMGTHPDHRGWIRCSCGFTKAEKPMINLEKYLKGRDVKYAPDYTEELKTNAIILIEKINILLVHLNETDVEVSSGWRPKSYNSTIPNASKTSKHITCEAVDLVDKNGKLKEKLMANLPLLERLGLYMEHPSDTPTWAHIQMKPPASGNRVFKAKASK